MIRLICIDVDGTLVGHAGAVHPDVWHAVERARAAGLRLAISSGRPGFGYTKEYAQRLEPDGWHIFQNGASVLHIASGESRSTVLPADAVAGLVERARRLGRDLELYTDDAYATESGSERARTHARLLGVPFSRMPYDRLDGPIVRAQWLLPLGESTEVAREPHFGLEFSPSLSPVMPDTEFVSLTVARITKASAVRTLADAYGIGLDEVMYVGDGANDAGAMRIVGWPIAMANAEPEAREAARQSVGHVDDGGLAEAVDLALAR